MKLIKKKKKEYQKEYYEANRDVLLENQKEYMKEYREINRKVLLEKKREKFNCPCGGKYTKQNKATHEKTQTHLDWLATQT